MNRFGRYSLFIALFGLLLAGCDSASTNEPDATPPRVLPAEAFSLQTNLFNQNDAGKTSAGANFTAAALRVWPVSVIISANLIVPVAVTAAALQADPIQSGNTWIWNSTVVSDGHEVAFTLEGTVNGSSINWSMRVSYTDGQQTFDDFELYTAVTDFESQTGTWQLFYEIDGQRRNVLNADFVVTGEDEAAITYSVPNTADRDAGDSVMYQASGDERVFDWRQIAEGFDHLVVWDVATHAGSITATNFNNGDKACWDENLDNAACAN